MNRDAVTVTPVIRVADTEKYIGRKRLYLSSTHW